MRQASTCGQVSVAGVPGARLASVR